MSKRPGLKLEAKEKGALTVRPELTPNWAAIIISRFLRWLVIVKLYFSSVHSNLDELSQSIP